MGYVKKTNLNRIFLRINIQSEFKYIPVLVTNNYVLGEDNIIKGKALKFTLNDDKISYQIIYVEKRECFTDKVLNISIIEIKAIDNIKLKIYLGVVENINKENPNNFYKDFSVYLLHYEKWNKVEVSFENIKGITE